MITSPTYYKHPLTHTSQSFPASSHLPRLFSIHHPKTIPANTHANSFRAAFHPEGSGAQHTLNPATPADTRLGSWGLSTWSPDCDSMSVGVTPLSPQLFRQSEFCCTPTLLQPFTSAAVMPPYPPRLESARRRPSAVPSCVYIDSVSVRVVFPRPTATSNERTKLQRHRRRRHTHREHPLNSTDRVNRLNWAYCRRERRAQMC